eukprot:2448771-Prymnesium_polylepis.1
MERNAATREPGSSRLQAVGHKPQSNVALTGRPDSEWDLPPLSPVRTGRWRLEMETNWEL